jgi:hypothetical protein
LLGLLLVHEAQGGQAFFELECMEKGAVLVVHPCIKDLLIPNDSTARRRNVHHLQPVGVADQVITQNDGALKSRIRPFRRIGVCYVESGDGDGLDLVGLLGHKSLDRILVILIQNGRHLGGLRPDGTPVESGPVD